MKFKKGDEVIVTAGKDKGKKGNIEKIMPKLGRVVVPGVNMYKKHIKPRGRGQQGGIVDIIRPLPLSNIALICQHCGKQTRIGFTLNGEKKRICRKCGKNT